MNCLRWTTPLVLSAVMAIAGVSEGEQTEVVEVESIESSELPKKVEVTEAVKLRLVGQSGSAGTVGLPKGATVEVTGRDGNMLQIVFVKSTGQIDIHQTTALHEVAKARSEKKAAEKERALKERIEASWKKRLKEMEDAKKRDILVHSWQWRQSAGGDFFEVVGEIENESGRLLENIQVEVTMRDANDRITSTETALVSDRDLRPQQRTTFKAMVRRVGGEQKAGLAFRKFWGERYTHREK